MALGQEELGRLIAEARRDAGLTQQELAERLDLRSGGQSISRYERGETEVPSRRLRRIAEITGKPLSYFLGEAIPVEEEEGAAERQTQILQRLATLERLESQNRELLDELRQLLQALQEPRRSARSRR